MRHDAFKRWLQSAGLAESSIRTHLSDAKRVDEHYGGLDDRYDEDQCQSVLAELEYTKEDERRSLPNPSKIPIDAASPYNGLQGYKAALIKYRDFLQAERTDSANAPAWDEYLRAANRLIESGALRRDEGYKDDLGSTVAGVRVALLGGQEDWLDLFIKALRDRENNLIAWQNTDSILNWIRGDEGEAQDALREMWTEDGQRTPVDRVRSFDGTLPGSVLSKGSSTARLDLASYLMMAMPGERLPPIKLTVFERTYDRLGYPRPDAEDLAGRYGHALSFLDRLVAESRNKGMKGPKTRMDAQSIVWSLRDNNEPASETEPSAAAESVEKQSTMNTNTILYGPPGTGKTYRTVERCVKICDGEVPDGHNAIRARYSELIAEGRIEFVTFHQSYGYEELVEGIRPITLDDGIAYLVQDGVLKKLAAFASFGLAWARLCTHARSEPTVRTKLKRTEYALTQEADSVELRPLMGGESRPYKKADIEHLWKLRHVLGDPAQTIGKEIEQHWPTGTHGYYLWVIYNEMWQLMAGQDNCVLVIDEINRANVSKVFGELITLLEDDKRGGADNEVTVTLPYSQERFTLPANLHILGTMNTADRSIALIDTALRRRFEFEEITPQPKQLTMAKDSTGVDLPSVLEALNARLEYLVDRDHLVGHAWFMQAQSRREVDAIMRRKIIPLLAEYFYEDWSKVHAVLGGGDGFLERQRLHQPPGLEDETGEARYRWSVRSEFAADAYRALVAGVGSDRDE